MEEDLFKYYHKMVEKKFLLSFKGMISQDILVGLGEMIKNTLTQYNSHQKNTRKVFSIFIELAQNILHYSAEKANSGNANNKAGAGIVVISEDKKFYTVTSGNMVKNLEISRIVEKCHFINQLNKVGLKEYYKKQIKLPRASGLKGGGIGLINIARKSENPLEVIVTPINDKCSFLILSSNIKKEGTDGKFKYN